MKKVNLYQRIALLLIANVFVFASCKKDKPDENEASVSYPIKIEVVSNYNNTTQKYTMFDFVYSDKKQLTKVVANDGDSIYNAFTYNAAGKLTKMGTTKNPNAFRIEYAATGDVSKVTESYRGPGGLNENYRAFEYNNGQIAKTKEYFGNATLYRTVIFNTNAEGNIVSSESIKEFGNKTATYTYKNKVNPLYGLKNNPSFSFLPERLWADIELILYSKNLLKEWTQPGDGTRVYDYTFDSKNRIFKITESDKTSKVVSEIYTITYLD